MNVVLVGMPGSGKTTVSRILGKLLKMPVYDTDELVEKEHGKISDIFQTYGEEHFRNLETQSVKKVASMQNVVISTGGGCILKNENVILFKSSGKIVYLRAGLQTLILRVEGDTSRPLLKGKTAERLEMLYKDRANLYQSAADICVDTDKLSAAQVAQIIFETLKF